MSGRVDAVIGDLEEVPYFENESAARAEFRREAFRLQRSLERPLWRRSKWWRTDLGDFNPFDLSPLPPGSLPTPAVSSQFLLSERDGEYTQLGMPDAARRAGVVVADPFDDATARERLGSLIPSGAGKYEALNDAFLTSALYLFLPPRFKAAEPFRLRFGGGRRGKMLGRRFLLVIGEGARLSMEILLEEEKGQGPSWISHIWEIFIGAGARVKLSVLGAGTDAYGYRREAAHLDAGADLEWVNADLGGRFLKSGRKVVLAGEGARYRETAIYLGREGTVFDLVSDTEHKSSSTRAEVQYRGSLIGRAEASFEGILRVRRGSRGSQSHLLDQVLTLGSESKYDTIPSLEIEENDVKVSHGASVSRIDPEEVFYLMSRGLPAEEARRMIIRGFFEAGLRHFPTEMHELASELIQAAVGP